MKTLERYFWLVCIVAALLGLFLPRPLTAPLVTSLKFLLGTILLLTGLKLDFRVAFQELRRPGFILYMVIVILVLRPLCMYGLARAVLPPALAVGVLILASMPSGTACSPLTDIVKGNASLALVGTLVTSLLCPLTSPVVVQLASGLRVENTGAFLLKQVLFLALILFVPLGLSAVIKRLAPLFVARHREGFTGLSIAALGFLIMGALASVSDDFMELVHATPGLAAGLFGFMLAYSAILHVAGYWMAPWRSLPDRAALSVDVAYVNNGLAIVFAAQFFRPMAELGASAVLPSIFLEVPMALMLIPLRSFVGWKMRRPG